MKIYKLTPLPARFPDWKLSSYKGDVILRADDEEDARKMATLAFTRKASEEHDGNSLFCPWRQRNHVSCEEFSGHDYRMDGPREILKPEAFHYVFQD